MKNYILECCVDSVESAIQAERGGASRIELCSNLVIGGTTPDVALVKEIRKYTNIRMHALIRPRFGDFYYTNHEMEIMKTQIRDLKSAGVEGIVIGVLDPFGNLDLPKMQELIQVAKGMTITLHRAFDMCQDPHQALEEAIELGVDTILTSGQKQSAWEGRELLEKLVKQADGRIVIMAGAGVNASVIKQLLPQIKTNSYHMSGKITLDSPMIYRNPDVSMGLPSFSEYEIWQTSREQVKEAIHVLESYEE